MTKSSDLAETVRAWLAHIESIIAGQIDPSTNDAFLVMTDAYPESQPELAWRGILLALADAKSEKVVGVIGAGALETLMTHHGKSYIDLVEREAGHNARLRSALEHVWNIHDVDVRDRVRQVCTRGEGKPS